MDMNYNLFIVVVSWSYLLQFITRSCQSWYALTSAHAHIGLNRLAALQYQSSFQSSTLIGRAVTRSQTSLGVRARFRLEFRAEYDVF